MFKKTLCMLALATLAGAAQAHQVWLEQAEGGKAVLRFGEFGDNLREASPGLLDNFVKPAGTLLSGKQEQAAQATKTADGFALPFAATDGESIVAEEANYPIHSFERDGKKISSWYRPAARLVTSLDAQPPKLLLDITPTGNEGEFLVTFNGKPLPKTEVELVTQSGWAKSDYSDDKGLVSFDMPWKGQYVAEVSHTDRTPGERQGEKFDGVSYVTSLTYVKPAGVEPIPAGPAMAPNKK
ncbi:DUF4198 domain-containing protein [Bordetella trematum]|uniref:DUF4198 domain-containing protein n=1 Tax=Bordetella trematum TaxID=123899 RepID=UPI000D9A8CFE|nr:DUF4198 domain-containing protein [Bordetella trematum]SPU50045.1 Nickel uptake substrate-specific transmembrane region [Bordetella trematum]VDH07783.1 Nickel uptake substrate-specific transmembrane region [Bordetella trematum]